MSVAVGHSNRSKVLYPEAPVRTLSKIGSCDLWRVPNNSPRLTFVPLSTENKGKEIERGRTRDGFGQACQRQAAPRNSGGIVTKCALRNSHLSLKRLFLSCQARIEARPSSRTNKVLRFRQAGNFPPRLFRINRNSHGFLEASRNPHGFFAMGDVLIRRPCLVAWPAWSEWRTQRLVENPIKQRSNTI
jgi:hypothetical protein